MKAEQQIGSSITDASVEVPSAGLARVLTFRDLLIYGVAYVSPISAWGTFAYVYSLASGAVMLAYTAGIVCLYFTAQSYSSMANEVEGSGSAYAYASLAFGPRLGFVAGWMVLLDYILMPALMYVLGAVALGALWPGAPRPLLIMSFAAVSLLLNWFGIRASAKANLILVGIQAAAALTYVLWAFAAAPQSPIDWLPTSAWWNAKVSAHGTIAATSLCLLAFIGFDAVTTLAGEVRKDHRPLVGRAVICTLAIVAVMALLQVWVMAGVAQGYAFADLATGPFDMTAARIHPLAGAAMAWFGALAVGFAITPPAQVAVSRVLYAMARDGTLPSSLGVLDPRTQMPRRAILLSVFIASGVALGFQAVPDQLTTLVNFGALAAFISVHLSVVGWFHFQRKSGQLAKHVLMPAIGIATIVAVMTQMNANALWLGLGWLVLGVSIATARAPNVT